MHLSNKASFFWSYSVPLALMIAFCVLMLPSLPASDARLEFAQNVIARYISGSDPKVDVKFKYFLMSGAIFLASVGLPYWFKRPAPSGRIFALLMQILITVGILRQLEQQNRFVHEYFNRWHVLVSVFLGFLLALTWPVLKPLLSRVLRAIPRTWVWITVFIISVSALTSSLVTDLTFYRSAVGTLIHIPYTMADHLAVLNGRTPWVDYFSQYTQLLSYLGTLLFKMTGPSIGAYTSMMAALSLLEVMLVFWIFSKTTRRASHAGVLFVLWLGISFFPFADWQQPSFYSPFTYFAGHPTRILGPIMILAAMFSRELRPTSMKAIGLGVLSGLVMINNVDFGLPAVGAMFVALLVTRGLRVPLRELGLITLGIGLSVASFLTLCWMRGGSLPNVVGAFDIILAFGRYGFGALPLPREGLQWIIYLTSMMSCALAVLHLPESRPRLRNRAMASVFIGVWVLGTAPYYLNRSHSDVLQFFFSIWALQVVFLALPLLEGPTRRKLEFLPRAWIFIAFVFFTFAAFKLPYPWQQIARLSIPDEKPLAFEAWSSEVRALTQPGDPVALIHPWGFRIAEMSQTVNLFPFPQLGSIMIKAQLEVLEGVLRNRDIKLVWGETPDFIIEVLERQGFSRQGPQAWRRDSHGAVWSQ